MSNMPPNRRGIAMLLVMVSIAVASILASAYLVSRDNSLAISRNSVAATQARWAAMSGLEMAIAILQTKTNWRTNHIDGMLPTCGFATQEVAAGPTTGSLPRIRNGTPPAADWLIARSIRAMGSGSR